MLLAASATEQTRAVDDRIHHRVGHPEEKYPDEISVVDMRRIHECVDDKRHLASTQSTAVTVGLPQRLTYHQH